MYQDENRKIERWLIPLNTNLIHDLLQDPKIDIGTFVIHEKTTNEYMLTLKNVNELSQIKITCIPSKCSYFIGSSEDILFNNLSEIMANILSSRMKIIVGENIELLYKNFLPCPLPVKNWFLLGCSDEAAISILNNYKNRNCFAVWMINSFDYKLGIKFNDVLKTIGILNTKRGYTIDTLTYFNTLEKLIDYYINNPVPQMDINSINKTLPLPVICTTFYASMISQKVEELFQTLYKEKITVDQFYMEFIEIEKLSKEFPLTFSFATDDGEIEKNRYKNILACDQTRVKLEGTKSTYINANYVKSPFYLDDMLYIFCQAPMASTFHDHWRMVIQQKVSIILMLTKCNENGVEKSYKYWPDKDEILNVDNHEIIVEKEMTIREITHREIFITNTHSGSKQKVYMIHYLAWPDYGIPTNCWGVIEIIIQCNQIQANSCDKTILIHCSAGIGRTGTIGAINMILRQIKHEGVNTIIDIKKTVLELRKQRALSVNTAEQYKFIYLAIQSYMEWKIGKPKFLLE